MVDAWLKSFNHNEMVSEFDSKYADGEEEARLADKYVQYIKFLFGGQKFYIGRSLAEVHKDLGITDEQFDVASRTFVISL